MRKFTSLSSSRALKTSGMHDVKLCKTGQVEIHAVALTSLSRSGSSTLQCSSLGFKIYADIEEFSVLFCRLVVPPCGSCAFINVIMLQLPKLICLRIANLRADLYNGNKILNAF